MPQSPARPERNRAPRLSLKLQLRNPIGAPVDRSLMLKVARRVIAAESPAPGSPLVLGLHLLDDASLRDVNREQRGEDVTTDVLAFPLLANPESSGGAFVLPPGEPQHLGDVLISYERARAQAEEYGHTVRRELGYLLAHGVLHLLGYDHLEEQERQIMRGREETALTSLGLTR